MFWAFAEKRSAAASAVFASRIQQHLDRYGVSLRDLIWQTDNGGEFKGNFPKALGASQHARIPPAAHTYQSDVETVHRLEEDEFFDLEEFSSRADFLAKVYTYQLYFNIARPNSHKENLSPWQIIERLAPRAPLQICLLPPVFLDYYLNSQGGYDVPRLPYHFARNGAMQYEAYLAITCRNAAPANLDLSGETVLFGLRAGECRCYSERTVRVATAIESVKLMRFFANTVLRRQGAALSKFLRLRHWIEATVPALGAGGIFLIAFLDSSFLTFPVINDLLVIELSILHPLRMPLYAVAATLGSLAGSLCIFFLARKGGEIYWHRHAGGRGERVREWLASNSFIAVAASSLMPPPMPFKIFVIGAGVFQVSAREFSLALLAGRGFRYFGIGFLAVRYGQTAEHYLFDHKIVLALVGLTFLLLSYLVTRLAFRKPPLKK